MPDYTFKFTPRRLSTLEGGSYDEAFETVINAETPADAIKAVSNLVPEYHDNTWDCELFE